MAISNIPEIYFDHQHIRILRYIKRHKDCKEADLIKRFGDDAKGFSLINMCRAGYTLATRPDKTHTDFSDGNFDSRYDFTYWVTPKGRKILDNRFDRLWQWSIPTLISVAALVISIISAVCPDVIRVIILNWH